jgi:hypothetical protein
LASGGAAGLRSRLATGGGTKNMDWPGLPDSLLQFRAKFATTQDRLGLLVVNFRMLGRLTDFCKQALKANWSA